MTWVEHHTSPFIYFFLISVNHSSASETTLNLMFLILFFTAQFKRRSRQSRQNCCCSRYEFTFTTSNFVLYDLPLFSNFDPLYLYLELQFRANLWDEGIF